MKKLLLLFSLLSLQSLAQTNSLSKYKVANTGFIENKGQIVDQNYQPNPEVKYLLTTPGFNVQLRQTGFSYDTYTDSTLKSKDISNKFSKKGKFKTPPDIVRHYHRVDIELVGCNRDASLFAEGKSSEYFNYFTAGTPQRGVSEMHYYKKVTYKNIYPNIDLAFSLPEKDSFNIPVEYNFIIHNGGNPADIKLQYKGVNKVNLINNKLKINVIAGYFSENIPSCYLQNSKKQIRVDYLTLENNIYGFSVSKLPPLESGEALIIDPTPNLAWGTYYGGTGYEQGFGIAVDSSDNVYVTGQTSSITNIATAGAYQTVYNNNNDVFVAKFNSIGSTLLWATYYGGSGDDLANGIALDDSDNVYITGFTTSPSGIATVGAYQSNSGGNNDAFIAKFNSTGSALLMSTYYGGRGNDWGEAIAVDALHNVYITGYTNSDSAIATAGAHQTTLTATGGENNAFVAKFNSAGSTLLWGTYYGGTWDDYAYGIALNASDNVYITGKTASPTGIATAGSYQPLYAGGGYGYNAYAAEFNSTGSALIWGTYYGASGNDIGYSIALGSNDTVYVEGSTQSFSGIATVGSLEHTFSGSQVIFVVKLSPNGASRIWGTYFNDGDVENDGSYMVLDACDNVYLAGDTRVTGTFPRGIATKGAYDTVNSSGGEAGFIAKINVNGNSLLWGTYYGGGDLYGMALDNTGNVFITGTTVNNFGISTVGSYQSAYAGGGDVYVAKFDSNSNNSPLKATESHTNIKCYGECTGTAIVSVTIGNCGASLPYLYNWAPSGGTKDTATGLCAGTYSCTIRDPNSNSTTVTVTITQPPLLRDSLSSQTNNICYGGNTGALTDGCKGGAAPYSYSWSNGATTVNATALTAGCYTVTVTDANGCVTTASSCVTEPSQLTLGLWYTPPKCNGECTGTITPSALGGTRPYTYSGSITNLCAGTYTITVTDSCGNTASASTTITQPPLLKDSNSIINLICHGDSNGSASTFVTGGTTPYIYQWAPFNSALPSISNLKAGIYYCIVQDKNGCNIIDTLTINQPPAIKIVSLKTDPKCNGDSNGSVNILPSGGILPYTYLWSNSQTNQSLNGLSAGTYFVTITDSNGCMAKDTIALGQPPAINLSTSSKTTPCPYDSGGVAVTASGGTGAYTYNWKPGGRTNASISGLSAGTYSVTVTDSHGCSETDSAIVKSFAVNYDSVCCNASIINGQSIPLNIIPGFPGETYAWYPSLGLSCDSCPNPIASPANSTEYAVTITDSMGCIITEYVFVDVSQDCNIFIPTGFSPNNDGQNDILYVKGPCIQTMDFIIYDRWGNKVFESENINNGWDGNYKAKPMNAGTFVYYLKAVLNDQTVVEKKGSLELIR